jgi:hypothetical protein
MTLMTTGELSDIRIHMTESERDLFEKYLRKARYYLEYGCGGSTEAAVRLKVGRIISIESDKAWVKQLSQKPEIEAAIEAGKLKLMHVDIGPVGAWGTPTDKATIGRWPKYFLTPFEKFSYDFDTVLIDGRFRIGCALACHAFLKDDAVMMMHDYQTRDGYSEVEKFFEIVEYNHNLFVFKKKSLINPRSFYSAVMNSMFHP